jgi:hypothetical protein
MTDLVSPGFRAAMNSAVEVETLIRNSGSGDLDTRTISRLMMISHFLREIFQYGVDERKGISSPYVKFFVTQKKRWIEDLLEEVDIKERYKGNGSLLWRTVRVNLEEWCSSREEWY